MPRPSLMLHPRGRRVGKENLQLMNQVNLQVYEASFQAMPRPSPHLMNQVNFQQVYQASIQPMPRSSLMLQPRQGRRAGNPGIRWRNPNLPRHQKNPRLRRSRRFPRNQENSRLRSTRCGWCHVECEEILDFNMCCLVNSSRAEEL